MSDNYNAIEEMNNVVQDEQNVDMQQEVAQDEQAEQDVKVKKAFPISKRTKNDQSRTSVMYTVATIVLYVLAYLPIFAVSLVLAVKCYKLVPYYTFWPFVGVIIAGLFGIIFMTITLVVTRKKSKRSIRSQTVRTLIAFVCLTCVFGLILTYIFPDVIAKATQGTLYCEDLYYNGEAQAQKNAKLERDFFMYNVLNGNLNEFDVDSATGEVTVKENGDFAYSSLVKRQSDEGTFDYDNAEIQALFDEWIRNYDVDTIDKAIATLKKENPTKIELYEFIYKYYVLNDYDYAFKNDVERRAIGLAVTDYIYAHFNQANGGYEGLLKQGFSNPRVKKLFVDNYNSFNQDGYLAFDDPLLLLAQANGRMTIPVVLRLILNKGWTYTQPGQGTDGNFYYGEDGNFLYQLFDKELVDEYRDNDGTFDYVGTIVDQDGKEVSVKYGFNEDGWMLFENGYTRRPMKWLVLDMLGDPMELTSIDNSIVSLVVGVLDGLGAIKSVGGLVQDDLAEVIKAATNGSALSIGLCINDDNELEINLFSMNAPYGMLGYMQATWVDSDNLLFAVINVVSLRNWFCTLGAVGVVLIIAAGVCRDMGEKTRKRTEDSRDRIILAKELNDENETSAPEQPPVATEATA